VQPSAVETQPLVEEAQSFVEEAQPLAEEAQILVQEIQPLVEEAQSFVEEAQPLVEEEAEPLEKTRAEIIEEILRKKQVFLEKKVGAQSRILEILNSYVIILISLQNSKKRETVSRRCDQAAFKCLRAIFNRNQSLLNHVTFTACQ
jgi:hypothetical protein